MNHERAFTLLEIMVAMILLTGTGFAILSSMISVAKLAQPTNEKYAAFNLARQNAEDLTVAVRQDCVTDPALCGTLNLDDTTSHTLATTTIDGLVYKPTYTVQKVDADQDGQDDDYRKVVMNICWNADGTPC